MIVQNQGVLPAPRSSGKCARHRPFDIPASYVVVVFVAGGYQNEFPVVTHGWSEKVRGRQGERTTTPQTIERSTKNQAPDILEYLLTKIFAFD
jgi:hypothetical protein